MSAPSPDIRPAGLLLRSSRFRPALALALILAGGPLAAAAQEPPSAAPAAEPSSAVRSPILTERMRARIRSWIPRLLPWTAPAARIRTATC